MDDTQLAMVLTAMSDQTVAMNRMADAMTGILLHLDPKQAAKFAAPGYMRPLAAYATFEWNSIDAHVIAFDRHGATEVEHNGVAYRRYRSNDDDPKGVDIRFRRVVAGTPEGKDMVWATLIKFADKRQKDPPRPLRGELAEKIEQAQTAGSAAAEGAQPAHAPAAVSEPAPLPGPPVPTSITAPTPTVPPWAAAGVGPATRIEPEPSIPTLAPVSDVNRSAVSSLQANIDGGYFKGEIGNKRLGPAVAAAKEQLTARGIDEAPIKASLAKPDAWSFLKAAVAAMVKHDLAAPGEDIPF